MITADIISIVTGALVLSALHALIPNHWLPVLAISRKENWTMNETTFVTFISGLAHALSTLLIGFAVGFAGLALADTVTSFTEVVAPIVLIVLGLFFIYRHHRHKHFKIPEDKPTSKKQILYSLTVAMFFSPCFEIEGYFLMAGAHGWLFIVLLGTLYTIITMLGMVLWIRIAYSGLVKLNWHALEHNAGIITGITLIITGIISFYIH